MCKYPQKLLYILFSLTFLTAFLPGCNSGAVQSRDAVPQDGPPVYKIYEEDGAWYFEAISDISTFSAVTSGEYDTYAFQDAADMHTALKTGVLSDAALADVHICSRSDTKLRICDPDGLIAVTAPDGIQLEGIRWEHTQYSYIFTAASGAGEIFIAPEDDFYKKICTAPATFPFDTCARIPEKNALGFWTFVNGYPDASTLEVSYSLDTPKGTLYLIELYENVNVQETSVGTLESRIPDTVYFYLPCEAAPIQGIFNLSKKESAYDWLARFDVQKYVPAP